MKRLISIALLLLAVVVLYQSAAEWRSQQRSEAARTAANKLVDVSCKLATDPIFGDGSIVVTVDCVGSAQTRLIAHSSHPDYETWQQVFAVAHKGDMLKFIALVNDKVADSNLSENPADYLSPIPLTPGRAAAIDLSPPAGRGRFYAIIIPCKNTLRL